MTQLSPESSSRTIESRGSLELGEAQIFSEEELLRRLMGDEELAVVVVNGFLEDVPKQLVAIRSSLAAGDVENVASVAHGIRGAASMLSGAALAKAAFAMEKAGNAGDLQALSDSFSALEQQFDAMRTAMKSVKIGS